MSSSRQEVFRGTKEDAFAKNHHSHPPPPHPPRGKPYFGILKVDLAPSKAILLYLFISFFYSYSMVHSDPAILSRLSGHKAPSNLSLSNRYNDHKCLNISKDEQSKQTNKRKKKTTTCPRTSGHVHITQLHPYNPEVNKHTALDYVGKHHSQGPESGYRCFTPSLKARVWAQACTWRKESTPSPRCSLTCTPLHVQATHKH